MTEEFQILLRAAIANNAAMVRLGEVNPDVLCETNEKGNTCLHIAALCGHKDFCTKILEQESRVPSVSSLLSVANMYGETPLLIAVKSGHVSDKSKSDHDSLADHLLQEYSTRGKNQDLLTRDVHGCNVLHYAIRNGYKKLALNLINQQPALSESCNNHEESPMFMAVLKGFDKVYVKMLSNENSKYTGPGGYNVLHAAVKYGDKEFIKQLVDKRPEEAKNLAKKEDHRNDTPMHLAAGYNSDEILKVMLECDRSSLGYTISMSNGIPLLYTAASRGHVAFAWALLEHCPDAPYCINGGRTCLHEAVEQGRIKFVEFILEKNSKLCKLVNMLDNKGDSVLHLAVKKCNPKMVSALRDHPDIDITVINNLACTAVWNLNEFEYYAKTINWNKIFGRMYYTDIRARTDIYNLRQEIQNKLNYASRKDAKSLLKTCIDNTSLVAILMATITFAAAFTLPGGYSSDAGSEGLPIMARKPAFQAFLIFDTLGMCSSLAVAFVCVIARWTDFKFYLHYSFFTRKLMWFSYMATTLALATGLYTVLVSRLQWLAIAICVLSVLLPILTMLLGEWPTLNLTFQYGKPSNFIDMV